MEIPDSCNYDLFTQICYIGKNFDIKLSLQYSHYSKWLIQKVIFGSSQECIP